MGPSPTKHAYLLAGGSLQDFLSSSGRSSELRQISFKLRPSVKDLLEAQGIPHTAIFQVRVNGRQAPFHQHIHHGDAIVAYPFEEVPNEERCEHVFSSPSAFFADMHLGKLAKVLRLLGIDTQSMEGFSKQEIISRSNNQKRMILTRSIQLLRNSAIRYGYWIRSTDPEKQIHELFQRFHLIPHLDPFSRCMECNGLLREVSLRAVKQKIPPKVKEWHDQYFRCENCGQVYWQGSHFKKLKKKADDLIRQYS